MSTINGDPAKGATADAAVAFALGHGVIMEDLGRGYHKNPRRALSQVRRASHDGRLDWEWHGPEPHP